MNFHSAKLLILSALITLVAALVYSPEAWSREYKEPEPLRFQVQFNENDPYEIVLTAEKYRREFMDEDIGEREWRDVYFDRAQQLYEKALLIDPRFTYGYLSYGYAQLMAAQVLRNKAQHYQQATQLVSKMDPEAPWTHLLLGQLYCLQENWEQARGSLEKSRQLGADGSSLYAWLGYVLAATDNQGKAQAAYQDAVSANTDPASVQWARSQLGKRGKPRQQPPLIPPLPPRRAIHPTSAKMRLQVTEFEDATGMMGKVAIIFSRLLATTLFQDRRFQMVDVRGGEEIFQEQARALDTIVTGSIIQVDPPAGQFILDIKAAHPATGNLLLAEAVPISYTKQGDTPQIADKEVRKVADMIARKLARGEGRIVQLEGQYLIVNLGRENGIQSGFSALVIGKGEKTVKDPQTGDVLSRDIYLGEIVFERVEEKFSEARLLTPGRIFVRVGDIVRLK